MDLDKKVDISFVILTWNSQSMIERCVKTFAKSIEQSNIEAEFILVDNGSMDKTVDILTNIVLPNLPECCRGEVIKLSKNMGTTKSRNIALRKINASFCVVCDSDTEFLRGDWRQAINLLKNNESIGILAAHLYYGDNTTQQSVKKFPTLIDKILKLRKPFFRMMESTTDYYKDFTWEKSREVDTAISAFWMFRNDLIDTVGLLDEKIYYSPEDIDFCLRVWL
ncbi:MAG: glycosyltransferase, partial [Candidatus Omnitrophica bacterium]|nr:glycosyltransferase [Candidatus Omnitrophota bacterium]